MTTFPANAAELTSEWLSDAIGAPVTAFAIEPIGMGVGLVCDLVRVRVEHADGARASFVAQFPSTAEANLFVALVLNMYGRETRFYREFAEATTLGVPRCHAVGYELDANQFVLLLEDLEGARVVDQLVGIGRADAELATDQLARLHAGWWNHPALESVPRLCESPYPEVVCAAFTDAWAPVQEVCAGLVTPNVATLGDRFPDLIPGLMQRLSEPPWTLSHGDYRLDNLFFSDDPERPLVVIDWQLYDRSRGPRDLSYLLSQSMEPSLRAGCERALVERYVARLEANGITGYDVDQAWFDYRLATLFNLVYPVIAGGGLALANARAVALIRVLFARFVAAFEHLECADLA